jgi:hypothetical protein
MRQDFLIKIILFQCGLTTNKQPLVANKGVKRRLKEKQISFLVRILCWLVFQLGEKLQELCHIQSLNLYSQGLQFFFCW